LLGRFGEWQARLLLPLAFLAIVVPFGICLAMLTPPGQVADESAHASRAQALRSGQLIGRRGSVTWIDGSTRAVAGVQIDFAVLFAAFPRIGGPLRGISAEQLLAKRAQEWTHVPGFVEITPLAVYAPVFYIPGAIGLSLAQRLGAKPYQALIAGRIANLLCYAAMGLLALLVARRGQALMFCVLSVPMTVSLAGSLNQDGQIIAAAVLGTALLTKPATRALEQQRAWHDRRYWAGIALLSCVALVKIPYAGLAALAVVPLGGAGSRPLAVRTAALAIILAPAFAWTLYALINVSALSPMVPYSPGPLWPGDPSLLFNGPDAGAQLRVLLSEPSRLLTLPFQTIITDQWLFRQGIGLLGWLDLPLQSWLYELWTWALACAIAADLLARDHANRPSVRIGGLETALLTLSAVAVLIAIYQAQYLTWTPVGGTRIVGPSGRYWLPLVPLLAVAVPRFLPLARMPAAGGIILVRAVLTTVPVAAAFASLVAVPALIVVTYFVR
jgi:Predicted membrane protein (DUF2142)